MTKVFRITYSAVMHFKTEWHELGARIAKPLLRRSNRVALFVALISTATLTGCNSRDSQGRLPISGTVTLDGRPLPAGYLIFEPKSGQTMQSGGMIQNGKFDVPAEHGAAVGTYSVAIFSGAVKPVNDFQPGTPEYEAAAMREPGEQVPRKYNIDSILTAEVKPDAENKFAFELSTTNK